MFDIDKFIAECKSAMLETQPRLAVKELLERAMRHSERVAEALPPERSGVTPLYMSTEISILKVVWAPRMHFRPHDHLMWSAVGIYAGQEDNVFYRRVGTSITVSGGANLSTGDVKLAGARMIHAAENPRRTCTGGIHVYGGDIAGTTGRSEWQEPTLEQVPYDYERSKRYFDEANHELTPK